MDDLTRLSFRGQHAALTPYVLVRLVAGCLMLYLPTGAVVAQNGPAESQQDVAAGADDVLAAEIDRAFQLLKTNAGKAADAALQILEQYPEIPDDRHARLLWIAGSGCAISSRHEQAVELLTEGATIARRIGDRGQLRRILRYLAASCMETSRFVAGRDAALEAIEISREIGDQSTYVARLLNELAGNEERLGNYAAAAAAWQKGLRIAAEGGDVPTERIIRTNLAGLFADLQFRDDAIREYEFLLADVRAEGNEYMVAQLTAHLGAILADQLFLERALDLLTEARQLSATLQEPEIIATVHSELGDLYETLQQFDKARDHYEAALRLWMQLENPAEQISTVSRLAELNAVAEPNRNDVEGIVERARQLASLGDVRQAILLYRQAAAICTGNQNWEAACPLLQKVLELEQDRWSDEHAAAFADLQRAAESVERQHQIDELEAAAQIRDAQLAARQQQSRLLTGGLGIGSLLMAALFVALRAHSTALAQAHSANELLDRQRRQQVDMERRLAQQQRAESLDVLAAGIAHDFNNHLTAISVSAELAEQQSDSAECRDMLTRIRDVTSQAAQLTGQLVQYLGHQVDETATGADVCAAVNSVSGLLNSIARGRASVTTHLADHACPASVTSVQLRQILVNLVTNSVEACGTEGQVRLEVGTIELDAALIAELTVPGTAAPGRFQFIRVIDNGTGIPPQMEMRVFDPYFSTKRPGRGLGLSSVFGITRIAHGAIRIEPVNPRGTCVTVYLPAMDTDSATPALPADNEHPAEAPSRAPEIQRRTVLFVDDESILARLMTQVVEQAGYQAVTAACAQEALDRLEQHRDAVCCVVTDYAMPGENGLWLANQVRTTAPEIPVILCSGFAEHASATDSAITKFLQKPYQTADLLAAIRQTALPDPSDL